MNKKLSEKDYIQQPIHVPATELCIPSFDVGTTITWNCHTDIVSNQIGSGIARRFYSEKGLRANNYLIVITWYPTIYGFAKRRMLFEICYQR